MKDIQPEVRANMPVKFEPVFNAVKEVVDSPLFFQLLKTNYHFAFQDGAKLVLYKFLVPQKKQYWELLRQFSKNMTYYSVTTSRELTENTELKLFQLTPMVLVPKDAYMQLLRRTEDLFAEMCEQIRIYMALVKDNMIEQAYQYWINIFAAFAQNYGFTIVDEQTYEYMTNSIKIGYNQRKKQLDAIFDLFMQRFQELVVNICLDQIKSDIPAMLQNKEIEFANLGKMPPTNKQIPEIVCNTL